MATLSHKCHKMPPFYSRAYAVYLDCSGYVWLHIRKKQIIRLHYDYSAQMSTFSSAVPF